MRIAVFSVLILWSGLLLADDHSIDFDSHIDFSAIKTFTLHIGTIRDGKPELNNSLVEKKIGDAIRSELAFKGLKETADRPDLIVDYSITGVDYTEGRGGQVRTSEGTLVLDLTKRDIGTLVWRGVYRDTEKNASRLAQKLPTDVRRILSEYPPKQSHVIPTPALSAPATIPEIPPEKAAAAVLEIIRSVQEDTSYLGPSNHPGLAISLGALERTARAVTNDDGRSSAATATKNSAFFNALKSSAVYADDIAGRSIETRKIQKQIPQPGIETP